MADAVEAGSMISFAKQFVSDASRLVAFIIPLPSVERCAKAHEDYRREYSALRTRLEKRASVGLVKT